MDTTTRDQDQLAMLAQDLENQTDDAARMCETVAKQGQVFDILRAVWEVKASTLRQAAEQVRRFAGIAQ